MRLLGLRVPRRFSAAIRRVESGVSTYFDGPFVLKVNGEIFIRWPRGLSKKLLNGSRVSPSTSSILTGLKNVRLWTQLLAPVPRGSWRIDILIPEFLGRLGNNLVQLRNALAVAAEANIESVWTVGELVVSGTSLFTEEIVVTDGIRHEVDKAGRDEPTKRLVLVEADWYQRPTEIPVSSARLSHAQEKIGTALVSKLGFTGRFQSLDKCVIHYRTGDVFGPVPHKRYGPPPHSYYRLLIKEWNFKEVTLVCEDPKAPMVLALIEQLQAEGVSVISAKRTLKEDIFEILSCTHLVSSQGTFSISLGALNPRLMHHGYFESGHGHEYWHSIAVSCRNWVVREKFGQFSKHIHQANWNNSKHQNELVKSFPISQLWAE